jgi:tetratricopeptide (TPR) repeat protein
LRGKRIVRSSGVRGFSEFIAILIASLSSAPALHAQGCEPWVAKIVSAEGRVQVERSGGPKARSVGLGDTLCPGDRIRIGALGRAAVQLADEAETLIRLDEGTTLTFPARKVEKSVLLQLIEGVVHVLSRIPHALSIETPLASAGVEGTEFVLGVAAAEAKLWVFEGRVRFSNPRGQLQVGSGEGALARPGQAPERRVVVRPREAVEWALHYPPLIDLRPEAYPERLRGVLSAYRGNDVPGALAALEQVPAGGRDGRYFLLRAGLLLSVGRIAKAEAALADAELADPKSSGALALRSIVALVRDRKDEALRLAKAGAGLDPRAPLPQAALSYAYQGRFEIEKALEHARRAVDLDPEDALLWARVSELELSSGDLDAALQAAERAEALHPALARTETVLGFAYLMRIEVERAKLAFERAIVGDPADPLPRLGLGLARIRAGDLEGGTREIETAASLDPNNSLVRSYLGKAYYEEKRIPLDEREYAIAKELDPKDPTPWFYDAIAKQTTNRPVEALQDMQKAIELNDNRVVYRSRLSLDSDVAARSASLGRIYTDLGFQQLALVEGWKSVNTDPTNYSAHRFLADSYSALPRHEIARVSELLQSQLLQPINTTPIQPHLAESNLFLISAGGPGALSFNEFNPLFNRNGLTFQTSGLIGEHSTYGGEGVASGIYQETSFSVGGFHFTTDGFRENAGQRDEIANAFVQQELSPKTSIQAEYRYRNAEHGDVQQRFFPEDIFPGLTDELESNTIRLGGRHAFSPDSVFLGSFIYADVDARFRSDDFPEPGGFIDANVPETAFGVELQHLFRSRYLNLQSGAGYFGVDRKEDLTFGFPGSEPFRSVTDQDLQHFNVYAYADVNLLRNVTATLGLSLDSLRGDEDVDKDQVNPKFGITWNPFAGTTLRAAAFRALKRTLITDQTLEPTQVAGFNQFFDDANLTEAWRYGGAVDQKFTSSLFGGVELSKRDLTVPILVVTDPFNPVNRDVDWNEYLGRAYLFWTPHPWLALRAQYIFERFERDLIGPTKLDTQRVPLGIGFFHPSGLSASLTATYWDQDGRFTEFLDDPPTRSGSDQFWTVDAAISYRLPKRYGFISVGATNLFDEEFKFFEVDFENPTIQPTRAVFARVTLAFP